MLALKGRPGSRVLMAGLVRLAHRVPPESRGQLDLPATLALKGRRASAERLVRRAQQARPEQTDRRDREGQQVNRVPQVLLGLRGRVESLELKVRLAPRATRASADQPENKVRRVTLVRLAPQDRRDPPAGRPSRAPR